MRIINSVKSLRPVLATIRSRKKRIGFVPTMGALHEGHASLIRKSRRENNITVVSIFVNPNQFGPKEDFSSYPRPQKNDILLAKKEKVDIIFRPSEKEMYPTSFLTSIEVDGITQVLCGANRPGHFKGVTTVIGKLLNIVGPDTLYLGQKDAQQAVVIRRMINDLNWPVNVKVCPTVREGDGLAVSSRNAYLTAAQRRQAPILYGSLLSSRQKVLNGERSCAQIVSFIRTNITRHSACHVEYIACMDAMTLQPLKRFRGKVMIALAVKLGRTRLIDNIILKAT